MLGIDHPKKNIFDTQLYPQFHEILTKEKPLNRMRDTIQDAREAMELYKMVEEKNLGVKNLNFYNYD